MLTVTAFSLKGTAAINNASPAGEAHNKEQNRAFYPRFRARKTDRPIPWTKIEPDVKNR